jgi:hypothetical protein
MEDKKVVEKRTETLHRESEEAVTPGVKNINIGPDGQTQIQEELVDEPVDTTTVSEETTIEEHSEP